MSEHTGARLSAGEPAEGSTELYLWTEPQGDYFGSISSEDFPAEGREANARRLVAAWNACEHIPTADLEVIADNSQTDDLADLLVIAQRLAESDPQASGALRLAARRLGARLARLHAALAELRDAEAEARNEMVRLELCRATDGPAYELWSGKQQRWAAAIAKAGDQPQGEED